ncbi:MAG: MBOAT family protein [Lachnospiraceae bacterium]|nr:MBOAT family protein [Lachnospiraceae bacterium]
MAYVSLQFVIFTAAVTAIYFLFPVRKYQWTVLLAADYFFYLYSGYKYAIFIIFTTATIYLAGKAIGRSQETEKETLKLKKAEWGREEKKAFKAGVKRRQRTVLALALIANFGILIFLKYSNFIAGGLNQLISPGTGSGPIPMLKLFLPLGISFYTFQAAGYLIDVYNATIAPEKNFFKFALFISFFPQIVQGPISSFGQLGSQLFAEHRPEFARFKAGLELILWGYFKKMIIADRAVIAINTVTADYAKYSGTVILATALLYALQLYADFSAGIDISRGIAQMLGIDMVQNFRRPYFATSINDYWRRWHISLGTWMKNYIFYPVAMSKLFLGWSKKMKASSFGKTAAGAYVAKVLPTAFSSMIVFLVVGLWHGANAKYVAFGIWNGGIIMLSILLKPVFDRLCEALRIRTESFAWRVFRILRTFVIVLIGYYFDIAPGFRGALDMMRRSITDLHLRGGISLMRGLGLGKSDWAILAFGALTIFVTSVIGEKHGYEFPGEMLEKRSFALRWMVLFASMVLVAVWGIYGPGYDPAEFVYMQF